MRVIVKYSNRKMYDAKNSRYINLQQLMNLPLESFKVIDNETQNDITLETFFSYLANFTSPKVKQTKINVMKHCLNVLTA